MPTLASKLEWPLLFKYSFFLFSRNFQILLENSNDVVSERVSNDSLAL